jgi:hypothetical protein
MKPNYPPTAYGRRIWSLEHLAILAREKRSVITLHNGLVPNWPQPAAWVINMSGATLVKQCEFGLFEYKRKSLRN